MGFTTYAELLKNPAVVRILALSLVTRIPLWAANIVVVLHVVSHLDRSYAEAGLVTAVLAVALTVSGPWRGRQLDRLGLRRAVAPSLVVLAVCWSIAPWVGYWPLLGFVALAGLFTVPSFSIIRQVLLTAVTDRQRTAALSIDSVVVEASFMVGPVLGVLAATYLPTPVALLLCQALSLGGAFVIWLVNPPLRALTPESAVDATPVRHRAREWIDAPVVLVLAAAFTATVVLTGADLGVVAALRDWEHATSIGWVLAVWGLGSAVGGLVYGALHRHPPSSVILALLSVSTALVAVADNRFWLTLLLFVSGLFCAPAITATVADLTRSVPDAVRGEAMGWHGSALTLGSALGAPALGAAIDHGGWAAGFVWAGVAGVAIGLIGATYGLLRRHVFAERVTASTR